jgi:hypothetical protein
MPVTAALVEMPYGIRLYEEQKQSRQCELQIGRLFLSPLWTALIRTWVKPRMPERSQP